MRSPLRLWTGSRPLRMSRGVQQLVHLCRAFRLRIDADKGFGPGSAHQHPSTLDEEFVAVRVLPADDTVSADFRHAFLVALHQRGLFTLRHMEIHAAKLV